MWGLRSRTSAIAPSQPDGADDATEHFPLVAGCCGMRRRALLLLALASAIPGAAHAKEFVDNPITTENLEDGTNRWDLTPPKKPAIEGYASEQSAAPGQSFHLHVKPGSA